MSRMTKLDTFDYVVLPGVIQIRMDSTRDPWIYDIISEIGKSHGHIYCDGDRYMFLQHEIREDSIGNIYLDLHVVLE